jgi:hypothetical protein
MATCVRRSAATLGRPQLSATSNAGANEGTAFLQAIAQRRCIEAIYNGGAVVIAPHILYSRHGDLHVDAVTLERDGQPPREARLGVFKIAGLKETRVSDRGFDPVDLFDPRSERYAGVSIFAVERA